MLLVTIHLLDTNLAKGEVIVLVLGKREITVLVLVKKEVTAPDLAAGSPVLVPLDRSLHLQRELVVYFRWDLITQLLRNQPSILR